MKVRFQNLQDNLRATLWARLERGDQTGNRIAALAGFRQAHLSNFLNGRRGLSLQAMDRLLDVLHLDVLDLANVDAAARHVSDPGPQSHDVQAIAVVSLAVASRSTRFSADHIQDTLQFRKSFLRRLKPKTIGNRRDWTRFVVAQLTEEDAEGMAPLLRAGALALIDRYYNTPPPPRARPTDTSVYAVLAGSRCVMRRLAASSHTLALYPLAWGPSSPDRLIEIPPGHRPADYIVGRVRHVSVET